MGGILVPGQWRCLGSVLLDLSGILASGLVHLGTALALMLLPYDSPLTSAAGTASPEMLLYKVMLGMGMRVVFCVKYYRNDRL